jgi:hypothetical protein
MSVRICNEPPAGSPDQDFVRVEASPDPLDDTATLVTIQRIVEMPPRATIREPVRRVKTLVTGSRMPADIALGLATRYAERKRIPVVYAHGLQAADRPCDDADASAGATAPERKSGSSDQ